MWKGLRSHHPHSHERTGGGHLLQVGEFLGISALGGYVLASKPSWQKVNIAGRSVPAAPLAGGALLALSLAASHFRWGGVMKKARPHLAVAGTALLVAQAYGVGANLGLERTGPRAVAKGPGPQGPVSTILGISERAPQGRVLEPQDIAEIARGRR